MNPHLEIAVNSNIFTLDNTLTSHEVENPLDIAKRLAGQFALTAAERDFLGGTPKLERDEIRNSGLLGLIIPVEYGGLGADWLQTMLCIREIAKADSSIAHVFGFQQLMLATVRLFSKPEQWQRWFGQTAQFNWFWGNALNPLDDRCVAKSYPGWYEFTGQKSFCSGATDSEMLIVSAKTNSDGQLLIAAIPTGRTGITV